MLLAKVVLTTAAANAIRAIMAESQVSASSGALSVGVRSDGTFSLDLKEFSNPSHPQVCESEGIRIEVQSDVVRLFHGLRIDYEMTHFGGGFSFSGIEDRAPSRDASHPGRFRLDETMLREMQPELFESQWGDWDAATIAQARQSISKHIWEGDSRAATVVASSPLIVAAYSDDFDWGLLLHFPRHIELKFKLQVGDRLISCNQYFNMDTLAGDLRHGPASSKIFTNFVPLIANFLTRDSARLNERKAEISEHEWARAGEIARDLVTRRVPSRDGRPVFADTPLV